MENRNLAVRCLSEALNLDSSGNFQAAFTKYLQSLHVLTLYLNELFASLGFQKMLDKSKEIKRVTCMIHECSDRINMIVDSGNKSPIAVVPPKEKLPSTVPSSSVKMFSPKKFPAFEKLQSENMTLLKRYQWRIERAPDSNTKTNLRLELERHLIENEKIAKGKFDLASKELQKERVQLMESEMKKLLQKKNNLSEKQKEKQELYLTVLEYTKTESWPISWELNAMQMTSSDAVKTIFQKTVRCSEHPLSQWLLVMQTNIKREIDMFVKQHSDLHFLLPDGSSLNMEENELFFTETPDELVIETSGKDTKRISKGTLSSLQKFLSKATEEITIITNNILEIFYLIYQSLLPSDSEEICYRLIETHILSPMWPNLLVLYRIVNISTEYKILATTISHRNSDPTKFGFSNQNVIDSEVFRMCIALLKSLTLSQSLTEKLRILVEVAQFLCGNGAQNQLSDPKLGADDLIPLLCYVIIKSGLPQLSSECCAIEQLFDMKYMPGEEGYALCSFLTALKYIEIRKMMDEEENTKNQLNSTSTKIANV